MNSTINNANTGHLNMIKSLREIMPEIKTEEAPKAEFSKQIPRDDLSSIAKQGLEIVQAKLPEIKTEEAPKFDYRAHSRADALHHLTRDILVVGGVAAMSTTAVKLAFATISHHKLDRSEMFNMAKQLGKSEGLPAAAITTLGTAILDAYDTIKHTGR